MYGHYLNYNEILKIFNFYDFNEIDLRCFFTSSVDCDICDFEDFHEKIPTHYLNTKNILNEYFPTLTFLYLNKKFYVCIKYNYKNITNDYIKIFEILNKNLVEPIKLN